MSLNVTGGLGAATAGRFECSRAGCRSAATRAIRWRNPKIHSADRRKIWLACDDHLEMLSSFLEMRGFPLEVVTVDDLDR